MVKSLSNNTGALVAAGYKWDQFEVDAGYTWIRRAGHLSDSSRFRSDSQSEV